MVEMHAESRWGSKFYESLSKDLASAMPEQKSFLLTNLKYMTYFYQLYSENCPQVVDDLNSAKISPQLVDELCSIPWGHHRYIIDKCRGNLSDDFAKVSRIVDVGKLPKLLRNGGFAEGYSV